METKKISNKELMAMIAEAAEKIKVELSEEVKKVGDPLNVKLNANDKTGDSDKAIVMKTKGETKTKSGLTHKEGQIPLDVKMNQQPSKGGSDEKAAAAVEVKAGAEKGGKDATTGQHKANFTSKDSGPKKEVSDPFVNKASDKMNAGDKVVDEGTKTFVESGAEKGGTDVTSGQHKATWKESAPKSDKDERIATGIQLKETYTKKELMDFIISEAKKKAKKEALNEQLKKIQEKINEI